MPGRIDVVKDAHVEELVGRCNNIRELDLSDATQGRKLYELLSLSRVVSKFQPVLEILDKG